MVMVLVLRAVEMGWEVTYAPHPRTVRVIGSCVLESLLRRPSSLFV